MLLISAGAAIVLYRMATWTPGEVRPPPPEPADLQSAQRKLRQAGRSGDGKSSRQGAGAGPFSLQLEEPELNAVLFGTPQAMQTVEDAGFREPRIQMENGFMTLSGYARTVGEQEAYVTLTGTPVVTPEGWLGIRIDSAKVGQIPAPAAARERVSEAIQTPLRDWSKKLGARLSRASVEGTTLLLEGSVRGAPGRS